jgi:hypothetical protein
MAIFNEAMLSGSVVTMTWRILRLDGGDVLQIWRVTVNILTKQSHTSDRGWPSSLAVGWGLTTPTINELYLLCNI